MKLTVKEIAKICDGSLLCGDENLIIDSYSKDTRTIKQGDCYVGIKGENFDGNKFWEKAFEKGAKACILDSFEGKLDDDSKYTILLVKNSVEALQTLATYVREQLNIPVVAVTGSVGKTSTKDFISAVLEQKYKVLKSPGNLNGQIGLPLNILSYQDEDVMVLEMGMNDFGQISTLSRIAKPTIAVITNIGTAHIGILGSRENILVAKLEILDGMEKGTPLIINTDNDLLVNLKCEDHSLITCGILSEAMYKGRDIQVLDNKTLYQVEYQNQNYSIELPLIGEVFALNSLLAVAVGDLLRLSKEEIQKGLANINTSDNHMRIFTLKNKATIIDDCYNSNLEALKSALKTLINFKGKRHIAILGDILELDSFSKDIHLEIGSLEEIKQLDFLLLTGKDAKYIQEGALNNNVKQEKILYFSNQEDLLKELKSLIKEDDVVLVKASNGMHFKNIVSSLEEEF